MADLIDISLKIPGGFKHADFDVKVLKKGLRKEGAKIAAAARRLVSKSGVSDPGGFPGRDSGVLRKSIKAKVSRSGFTATVKPWMIPEMGGDFYPAYVYYGHRGPKSRTAQDNRRRQKAAGEKVAAPRGNFIVEATHQVGEQRIESDIARLMNEALTAKEIKF